MSNNVIAKNEIKLPPFPKVDASESLLGIDKNKNYVRDDVEHFIYSKTSNDPNLYKLLLKWTQLKTMLLQSKSQAEINLRAKNLNNFSVCVTKFASDPNGFGLHLKAINEKLLNTDFRMNTYKLINSKVPDIISDSKQFEELKKSLKAEDCYLI